MKCDESGLRALTCELRLAPHACSGENQGPTATSCGFLSFRDTAKLINSALGGSTKDVELTGGSSLLAPAWVQKSERIRVELSLLKDRLNKLKE